MFAVMYFLLIRPQKKQQEQVKNMLDSLAEGDSVVTIGGRISKKYITANIAINGKNPNNISKCLFLPN